MGWGERRPGIGLEAALPGRGEGQAAQVRQASGAPAGQRSVEEARHVQLGGQPVGELVPQLGRGGQVAGRQVALGVGDERHHIEGAHPGMHALVAAQVDQVDRGTGQGAGGVGHHVGPAGQGEHGTVVVRVTVQIQQGAGGGVGRVGPARVSSRPSETFTTHSISSSDTPQA